jgi:hypothetical protein
MWEQSTSSAERRGGSGWAGTVIGARIVIALLIELVPAGAGVESAETDKREIKGDILVFLTHGLSFPQEFRISPFFFVPSSRRHLAILIPRQLIHRYMG